MVQQQYLCKNFIVEGNIGAGKSTFLKIIQSYLDIQVVFEPHTQWQHVGGNHNLLEKFYADPKRWAYTFQSYAFVTRVREQHSHAKKYPGTTQILERSVFSDRYCFAKNAYELGYMNVLEWQLYQEWFSWLIDNYVLKPNGFIYLQTDPEICYERLIKRNRHEEAIVQIEYLKRLHDKHELWLVQKQELLPELREIPILVLECNEDFETNKQVQKTHINKIIDFITIHSPISGVQDSKILSL